ncbi:MAG: hypothetical protein GXP63_02995 [DPANN group archaeon]|nr:hypothetical protein [DPANN group archaeon]
MDQAGWIQQNGSGDPAEGKDTMTGEEGKEGKEESEEEGEGTKRIRKGT